LMTLPCKNQYYRSRIAFKPAKSAKAVHATEHEAIRVEAFSVLTDAKQDDERKRAALHKFYEDTEDCLHSMDDKKFHNLYYKLSKSFLYPGETSSGKSTLLNLILGEQLLPSSMLSTTSTICELKYGATPKLVAHFKDKELPEKTILLSQSMETSQQNYLQQISSFVHVKSDREKGSDYKKIELYWPHSLLKVGDK
ncbi:mitofusin, partial [Desmophyllum pertusum]